MAAMPWKETDVMTEKERFVMLAQSGHFTLTDLCADFEISRKTGHKYLSRYAADGRLGLSGLKRGTEKGSRSVMFKVFPLATLI